jgi:V/A-type H+-transporting ATPase subunit I
MLRPERMSRLSVTGSKRVMDDVIETAHELNLFDVTDYDGQWAGFDPGDPVEGADAASETLVTVRSLQSILDVTDEDAGPTRVVTDEALEDELEGIRTEVVDLDDRRDELEDELRSIEEQLDAIDPFVELGIDLDLLSGYDHVSVAVGEGDPGRVREALDESEAVEAYEVFAEDEAVAAFVAPADVSVEDQLVGVEFTALELPEGAEDAEDPAEYVAELEHRRQRVESELETVEADLEDLRLEVGGFLLAAEEKLAIEVQKREAPLSFATTENAFVAEGWLPTERFVDLAEALQREVGDHVAVEELERADYRDHSFVGDHGEHEPEEAPDSGAGEPEPVAADGGPTVTEREVETDEGEASAASRASSDLRSDGGEGVRPEQRQATPDGGHAPGDRVMSGGEPPIRQDNPRGVRPFELLTKAVGRPSYTELDPTIILFLTFPLMFGFMIGDIGYGVVYTAIGYWMIENFDSETFEDFGKVAAAAGISTVVFGLLYGEVFGLHLDTLPAIGAVYTHPIIEKGLSPATEEWAQAWFVITALFGVLHLNIAWIFEFVEEYTFHGFGGAMEEVGSWLLMLNGLWVFVFSRLAEGNKPELLYTVLDHGEHAAFELGFSGLPAWAGWIGVAAVALGLLLLLVGPTHELIEAHQVLAHTLSYLRIAAVLLAKAGMAFAVNLLFFGAYETHGEYHFMLFHGPEYVLEHHPDASIMFPGMLHGGAGALLAGIVVLLIGHLVVLLLGITSAGIQSVRLEYFEFFSKFYDDGGEPYSPFGYDRNYTAEE